MKRFDRLSWLFFPLIVAAAPLSIAAAARADATAGVQALVRIEPAQVSPTSVQVAPGERFEIANRSPAAARVVFDRRAARGLECALHGAERVRTGQFVLDADGAISCTARGRSLSYTIFAPNDRGRIEGTKAKIVVRR